MIKKKNKQVNGEADFVESIFTDFDKAGELQISKSGKYRVIGVDKFSNEAWLVDEYDSPKKAVMIAEAMTKDAMPNATDYAVAEVYYAFTPKGDYLGGRVWEKKEEKGKKVKKKLTKKKAYDKSRTSKRNRQENHGILHQVRRR